MLSRCKKTPQKWAIVALSLILLAGCSSINSYISPTKTTNESESTADTMANTNPNPNINNSSSSTTTNSNSILYKNTQYGFDFKLPKSWEGFSIINESWEGVNVASGKVTEKGPLTSIRHPQWTSENPWQDIPIIVFTLNQWDLMKNEEFHIGAAPIEPRELGRNNTYVFALPARYNFAFPTGYQEVEEILKDYPLQATELLNPSGTSNTNISGIQQ